MFDRTQEHTFEHAREFFPALPGAGPIRRKTNESTLEVHSHRRT
jgi:hypothetical protein